LSAKKTSEKTIRTSEYPAAVIGLGLMGHSIIACLLAAGHTVVGLSRSLAKHPDTRGQVLGLLRQLAREKMLSKKPATLIKRLSLSEDVSALADCRLVIESIVEDVETKKKTYAAVEAVIGRTAIIASNTSAIPITLLQRGAKHPARFVGIHWDEPAHITRFMEVILGDKTSKRYGREVVALAELWGKEPSLLKKDIRGFITNRISYAMFREAFYLVESGVCTMEDVDRSLRNDVGWWMPFAGPFRYMDLMGATTYGRVMKDLLPELSTSTDIPPLMCELIEAGDHGISTGKGFFKYTKEQAEQWEKLFTKFNYEIRQLAMKYPADCGNRVKRKKRKK
jgi:3-hydroxybutyryl-CoA dehydrogenase